MDTTHFHGPVGGRCGTLAALALLATPAFAVPTVAPEFSGVYTIQSLGAVPGLPLTYGGLTFIDNDTLLIGGTANLAEGRLYTIEDRKSTRLNSSHT